jgi:hypothetical protein
MLLLLLELDKMRRIVHQMAHQATKARFLKINLKMCVSVIIPILLFAKADSLTILA